MFPKRLFGEPKMVLLWHCWKLLFGVFIFKNEQLLWYAEGMFIYIVAIYVLVKTEKWMRVQTHWSFAPFNLILNEPSMEFKEGRFVNRADFFEERRHSHCDGWHGSDSKNVPPLGLRGTNDIYISTLWNWGQPLWDATTITRRTCEGTCERPCHNLRRF